MSADNVFEEKVDKEYESLMFDIKYDKEQFKDPMAIGLLVYRLAQERKTGNQLFREIVARLDKIATLLEKGRVSPEVSEAVKAELSDVDAKLLTHIQRCGKVDAEQVQVAFGYKGKNAASARLNLLYQRGILQKGRAGKKVLYWSRG
jgi:hypothetical protein